MQCGLRTFYFTFREIFLVLKAFCKAVSETNLVAAKLSLKLTVAL